MAITRDLRVLSHRPLKKCTWPKRSKNHKCHHNNSSHSTQWIKYHNGRQNQQEYNWSKVRFYCSSSLFLFIRLFVHLLLQLLKFISYLHQFTYDMLSRSIYLCVQSVIWILFSSNRMFDGSCEFESIFYFYFFAFDWNFVVLFYRFVCHRT